MAKTTKAKSAPARITDTPEVVHLTKYPRMVQRYFIELDDKLTEVFKLSTKNEPTEGAKLFDIITSTGKTHVFATEVREVVKLSQAQKNREIAKLKQQFMAGSIDHQAYADAITKLI